MSAIEVRQITPGETIDLRHAVLRAGLPRESAFFENDELPSARHFGAFLEETLGAVASLAPAMLPERPGHVAAWQLRGMAVRPELRRRGLGSTVFAALVDYVARVGGTLLWCNARGGAVGFYERHGMQIVSEEFDIPTAGPHVRMALELPRDQRR